MKPYTSESYRNNVKDIEVCFSNFDYKKLFPNRIRTHDITDCVLLDMIEQMWKQYQFGNFGEFTHELWDEQIDRVTDDLANCEQIIDEYGIYASIDDYWEGRDVSSPESLLQSIAKGILRDLEPNCVVMWSMYKEKIASYFFR